MADGKIVRKGGAVAPLYTIATGGTTLTYQDSGKWYKSHTFLENGTFAVAQVGTDPTVDYLIIAGGGGGGGTGGGGGGAGGYRTTNGSSGANSSAESKVTITSTSPSPSKSENDNPSEICIEFK